LARNVAATLGIKTIGARGYVSEINEGGKGSGVFQAAEHDGVSFDNIQFIMFVPIKVKVTQTVKHNATMLGFQMPWYDNSKTEKN
jgi:hypothetical protein